MERQQPDAMGREPDPGCSWIRWDHGPGYPRATDAVVVEDVYVQNQPDPKTVKVFVTLNNLSGKSQKGRLD